MRVMFGHQFDAAVLRATFGAYRWSRRSRSCRSRADATGSRDSGVDQVIDDRVRAPIGQLQVVVVAADSVAVSVHVDIDVGIGLEGRRSLVQNGRIAGRMFDLLKSKCTPRSTSFSFTAAEAAGVAAVEVAAAEAVAAAAERSDRNSNDPRLRRLLRRSTAHRARNLP